MGRMLFETGVVGEREVMKAKKEAQAIGKGSFAWAWMLDERPEERHRGVTVDVAMARYLIFFVFALCLSLLNIIHLLWFAAVLRRLIRESFS